MNDLQLKKKPKKMACDRKKAIKFDPSDPSTIDWLNEVSVCDALLHHGQDCSEMKNSDLYEKIVLLCSHFKPSDIRPVFQGVCQEAGWDWRTLNTKHKSMKKLASEFANSCVDIVNAMTDFSVPGGITLKKNQKKQAKT